MAVNKQMSFRRSSVAIRKALELWPKSHSPFLMNPQHWVEGSLLLGVSWLTGEARILECRAEDSRWSRWLPWGFCHVDGSGCALACENGGRYWASSSLSSREGFLFLRCLKIWSIDVLLILTGPLLAIKHRITLFSVCVDFLLGLSPDWHFSFLPHCRLHPPVESSLRSESVAAGVETRLNSLKGFKGTQVEIAELWLGCFAL